MQFLPNPPLCNVPRNHDVVICSDIFSYVHGSCCCHMFMVNVAFTCLLFMLNGLERFCHFSLEVSTQSPLPNSCLEYGGLQCSQISIIHCVFYCFIVFIYGLFHFLVPFNLLFLFICFHLFSCLLIFSHFFSLFLISFHVFSFFFCFFFLLKKPLPI